MRGYAVAACALVLVGGVASPGFASECPGNPEAIGTSRDLTIDPIRYRGRTIEALPLDDHELVITFDDGPRRPATESVLDVLKAQCVKATFFVMGAMAREAPDLVDRA